MSWVEKQVVNAYCQLKFCLLATSQLKSGQWFSLLKLPEWSKQSI